ncbi:MULTISPECIES: DUF6119 family protein [unclassified Paenibacillus]|uniref:DUF6119 family protein n=1 Tax=unclassified Paenibacillus TaxID=185978 RepID=UPI0009549D3E|nr:MULTISPECIES: DUF6119 family protein [unclassified Paenibacillus]ASS67590.1 hypothetical protein CIC07_16615 [Paenibacillus sp. RUD330]SIQ71647.1 sporadically distributed protein, TIGR04141 family [Paenibacillus sp. RU4X]SIQ93252.1 sporadically distributed protein, TIGR04141 family [Paenibacillus sp. RU4T]
MKLSVYLLNEDVKDFKKAIQRKYLSGNNPFFELPKKGDLNYECIAFVQSNKVKAPKWLEFVGQNFDLSHLALLNASNSFLIILRVKNRVFAVPFGFAYSALDRSRIEQGFGMRVTLNEIDPERIETLDTRNIDLVTKQRRTHVTVGSKVSEFGLNQNIDWIRYVSGKPTTKEFASKLSGSDSLAITTDTTLKELGKLCEDLLEKFESNVYKKHFEFIDYLRPLKRTDLKVQNLNVELEGYLDNRVTQKVTVALPEIPESNVDHYKIFMGTRSNKLSDITLESFYNFLDDNPDIDNYLDKVHIIGLDSEGSPVTAKYKMREFIVAEINSASETFVLSLGNWFQVDNEYVKMIKETVKAIPDITDTLKLPAIKVGEKEGEYNERVGKIKNWLLFDKELLYFSSTEKYEICDLLTKEMQYLCVKKMYSSATLSHLFAQGSVSARLLRGDPRVEKKVEKAYSQMWSKQDFLDQEAPEFVYVIPTTKEGVLSECLFFFSLINLVDHVRSIKEVGYKVSLCKVEYED